jgi:uncharacterized protein involved in response to NO
MIVAVMTRTSLGHTGRPLVLHRLTVVAYVLLALATLVRAVGPALPGVSYITTIVVSAGLWASAFTLFLGVYGPILTRPRVADAREVRR